MDKYPRLTQFYYFGASHTYCTFHIMSFSSLLFLAYFIRLTRNSLASYEREFLLLLLCAHEIFFFQLVRTTNEKETDRETDTLGILYREVFSFFLPRR